MKARSFLSNISYRRFFKEDFGRSNFVIDIFTYLTMDLKPFFLHAAFNEENDRKMILMLWNQCVPVAFYRFVKQPENFEYLLSQNVLFRGVNDIVRKFAFEPQNWHDLKNSFIAYYSTYQYIYLLLFPKYYS